MTEADIIQKAVHWFAPQIWFLYDIGLRHERVKEHARNFIWWRFSDYNKNFKQTFLNLENRMFE